MNNKFTVGQILVYDPLENAFMLKKIINPLGDLLEKYNEQNP